MYSLNYASLGELNMTYDNKIIDVIEKLNCPILVSAVSEATFGSYSIIEISNLELVNSWKNGDYDVELYKGSGDDYLAILRIHERVFCAQYINGYPLLQDDLTEIPMEAYTYTITASASGMYTKTQIAFFLNSLSMRLVFSTPNSNTPYYYAINNSDCILSLNCYCTE